MANQTQKPKVQKEPSKKQKKKKKQTKKGQIFAVKMTKVLCIVLVVLMLTFIAADRFGNITFSSVGDRVNTMISGSKRGNGYPYFFENLQVKDVKSIDSDLLLINDSSTVVLDSTARKVSTVQHTYAVPLCDSNSGRTLMLDVGGNAYRVMSKSKVLYENTTDYKLLTGAIGKDGTVALAMRGANSISQLSVYNHNQKQIFNWTCAQESIVATDVSDNGKLAAVSVIGAENGELYSKVFLFDFKYAEPVGEFNFDKRIVSKVEFLQGDRLLATGTNVFSLITDKKDRQDEDLSLNTLSECFTSDSNTTVVILSKYGSATAKIMNVYDKKGDFLFTKDINSAVRSVSCNDRYFSVLTDDELQIYNRKGELLGSSPVENDGIRTLVCGNYTYVYFMGRISAYNTTNAECVDETIPIVEETTEPLEETTADIA